MHNLLQADLFSTPVRMKVKLPNGMVRYFSGSYLGLTLTVIGLTIWFGYFIILWNDMINEKLDKKYMTETLNEKFLDLSMKDSNFLPFISYSL